MFRISVFNGLSFPLGPDTENAVPEGKMSRSRSSPSVMVTCDCAVTAAAPLMLWLVCKPAELHPTGLTIMFNDSSQPPPVVKLYSPSSDSVIFKIVKS